MKGRPSASSSELDLACLTAKILTIRARRASRRPHVNAPKCERAFFTQGYLERGDSQPTYGRLPPERGKSERLPPTAPAACERGANEPEPRVPVSPYEVAPAGARCESSNGPAVMSSILA